MLGCRLDEYKIYLSYAGYVNSTPITIFAVIIVCVVHFKPNALVLRTHVSKDVYIAMLSHFASEAQPDLQRAFDIINQGGRKARDMVRGQG